MGSAVSITATIRAISNNADYMLCNDTFALDCAKAQYKGHWYLEPYVNPMTGISYKKFSTSQSDFSVEVVEVEFDGRTYFLSGTESDYTAKCNACCGATPVLTPIAVPVFYPCEDVCADSDGNYVTKTHLNTLYSGQTYTLKFYANSTLVGTSSAVASPAAALAYAQANWSSYGTWSIVDTNTLVLTSTDTVCALIVPTLVSHSFCLTVAYPFTFDEIVRSGDNGTTLSIPLPNGDKTVADEAALDAALTAPIDYFSDGAVTHATAGKVQYAGTGRPITLKLDGNVVGTWTTAACS